MRFAAAFLISSALLTAGEFAIGSKLPSLGVDIAPGKPTAVLFVSTNCPVSNAYNDRMKALEGDYASRGVNFVFLNANSNESAPEVAEHARKVGWAFRVNKDTDNKVADLVNAQYTPEVFLFDAAGKLAYHGRIDDSREVSNVKTHDTRIALDALLARKPVPVAETKAFGCTIKRAKKTS